MKKLLALILAIVAAFSCVACGGGGDNFVRDDTKTQLVISHFNGGFGDQWIRQMIKDFEATYANVAFEEGKVGVQVELKNHKDTATSLAGSFATSDPHIFFNSFVPYKQLVDTNEVYDITDVINGTFDINEVMGDETIPDVAEKNIIDKMTNEQKEALFYGNKVYAIPHYEGFTGITYDADYFDEKGFYMGADGEFGYSSTDEGLSTGPDGIEGTYDDGMPNTFEDFYKLCATIDDASGTPIAWSGDYQFYVTNMINAIIANHNGLENEMLFYTYDGTTDDYVTGFKNGKPVTGTKQITPATGYELFKQEGYYYGLKFLESIIGLNENYVYSDSFTDGWTHTDVQNQFLLSKYTNKRIAMVVEGNWWQNEADAQFTAMDEQYPGTGKYSRNLKWMPLPKATEDDLGRTTMLDSELSFMFIRSTIENDSPKTLPVAKLFLQFVNTTENLQLWSTITNTTKALNYSLTNAQLNEMTPFGRSVMEMKMAETTDIVYQLSTNSLYMDNQSGKFQKKDVLSYGTNTWASTAMHDDKTLTAEKYFEGLYTSWKSRWADEFGKYFN